MRNKTNFIGKRYGKYLVIESVGVNKHRQQLVKCRLPSGFHKTIRANNLYRIKRNENEQK